MKLSDKKIAVVTGGNKGVGYGACRLLAEDGVLVVLTARDEGRGKKPRSRSGMKGWTCASTGWT